MSFDFDFNIYNYTISDIEKFMGLSQDYTFNDITNNKENMKKIIIENKDYSKANKHNLIEFLEQAKIKLVGHLKNISEQDNGFIEDYNKLLIQSDESKIVNKTSTNYAGHNFVINKDTTSFNDIINQNEYLNPVETYPTNISRSFLNNLKRKTILQTVILNTLFREDYYNTSSTDFNIVLPYYFKQVLSVRLSSIQLPNVIYCISSLNRNNTLYIYEDNTGIEGNITIPDGNYNNATDFCQMLQFQINKQLNISPIRFKVSFDSVTGKISIENTTHTFNIIFYNEYIPLYKSGKLFTHSEGYRKNDCVDISEIYKKLGWIIGYRKAEYNGEKIYVTEGLYNGSHSEYIYLTLNDYNKSQSQNIFGMFSKSIIGDNILAMIPITTNSFNVCFDNGADFIEKKREYFGPVNIQKIRIQLLDQFGEIINLNNMDYSLSLEFEVGYDY